MASYEIHLAKNSVYLSGSYVVNQVEAIPMAEYQFVTRWEIAASIEAVWEAIVDSKAWPRWWSAVQSVEDVSSGEPNGIGSVRRYVWKMLSIYQ